MISWRLYGCNETDPDTHAFGIRKFIVMFNHGQCHRMCYCPLSTACLAERNCHKQRSSYNYVFIAVH